MKKYIVYLLGIATFILACSPRKDAFLNRKYQNFTGFYNTLFNSKDALNTEMSNREKSYKDDFYGDYIKILKTDNPILGSDIENNSTLMDNTPVNTNSRMSESVSDQYTSPRARMRAGNSGFGSTGSNTSSTFNSNSNNTNTGNTKGSTILEISEAKALKAITKHSMKFEGVEKNKVIFDAHILLAQSRMYQGKYLEALDALNYLFRYMPKDKRIDLAKIYQGQLYYKMGDTYKAQEIFHQLKDKSKLKKAYRKLLSIYTAEMLVETGKKEEAVEELSNAFRLNKNRELRSRIAFLRGQVLNHLNQKEEARASFVTAYKYANDFQFEVKSQLEIAKTFSTGDDYEAMKKYIEGISKKGTYASRKNEFYYALGLMANKEGKPKEADSLFKMSIKEKISDPQIRGLAYYELGQNFYKKDDYLSAGVYYDSAVAVMTHKPQLEKLKELTANIKKLSANYYLMKKNDSILALTKMSKEEQIKYFEKVIADLKLKEEKIELERKKAERNKGFEVANFSLGKNISTSDFSSFGDVDKGNKFYFANTSTVAKGASDFKITWGNRALADNWRYSKKQESIEDLKNQAMGVESVQNPRRFEPEFYIEKIPTQAQEIQKLRLDRDTAQLGLGTMYYEFFNNKKLANTTLYQLVDSQPEEEVKLKALYQLFTMNYKDTPQDAAKAKEMILKEFPYTPYAEFVRNPKASSFTKTETEVEDAYQQAYQLYLQDKFEDAQNLIQKTIDTYPKDGLIPKLYLLQAYNTGKIAGKEIMILQLEQIVLNYPKTSEGEKAAELLKYLKSDLKLEVRDNSGAVMNTSPNTAKAAQGNTNMPRAGVSNGRPNRMSPTQSIEMEIPREQKNSNRVRPPQGKKQEAKFEN